MVDHLHGGDVGVLEVRLHGPARATGVVRRDHAAGYAAGHPSAGDHLARRLEAKVLSFGDLDLPDPVPGLKAQSLRAPDEDQLPLAEESSRKSREVSWRRPSPRRMASRGKDERPGGKVKYAQ